MNHKTSCLTLSVCFIALLLISFAHATSYIGDSGTVMYHQKYSLFPYSYVIEPFNSTHIQSTNASGYVYQSTNASQVSNFALGNLTSGRTWKETVLLKGNITLTSPIDASAGYLHLIINGELWLASGSNCHVIQAYNATEIEVEGGKINGNEAGQTGGLVDLIHFEGVQRSWVHDSYLIEAERYGIYWKGFSNNKAWQNTIQTERILNAESCGIFAESYFSDNFIGDCQIGACGSTGIQLNGTSVVSKDNGNNRVIGNHIWGSGNHGLVLQNSVKNMVSGNVIESSQNHGLYLRASQNNEISGNEIWSNSLVGSGQKCGVYITDGDASIGSDNNTITGGHYFTNSGGFAVYQAWGIYLTGTNSRYNMVIGASCMDNVVGGIFSNEATAQVHLSWNSTSWLT